MKIYEIEIAQNQIDYVIRVMKDGQPFRASAVEFWLASAGVSNRPTDILMRAADRIIQREKKSGNIHQIKRGVWQWKGSK